MTILQRKTLKAQIYLMTTLNFELLLNSLLQFARLYDRAVVARDS